ncbi:hypothetical protein [Marimonas lutisalis]|nr:hypothetical protein [Marimonas lutisalis]
MTRKLLGICLVFTATGLLVWAGLNARPGQTGAGLQAPAPVQVTTL